MSTAEHLIKGALRKIGAYQSGDPLAPDDATDCLLELNEMLDQWSTDAQYVFGSQEHVLQWVAGKSRYLIGNPSCTDLGEPPFTGTVTATSGVITGVTNIPADLKVGATLSDTYGGTVIPMGALVTAIGASTVTFAPVAVGSSVGLDSVTYTVPGDFAIPRPLRITSGLTTINNLDFTLDVYESESRFLEILYKAQPGPWPVVGWYNNMMPYGELRVYQTPAASVSFSLWTSTILTRLSLTQVAIWPQGYDQLAQWGLARQLWPQYWGSKPWPQHNEKLFCEALMKVKSLNDQPAQTSTYDPILTRSDRADAGFVLHGGYR